MQPFPVQVAFFFVFILITGYLIPAGQFYLRFYVWPNEKTEKTRIQSRQPTKADIIREVKHSLVTVFIFALLATFLWRAYRTGQTSIYHGFGDYPLWWLPASFVLLLVFHDTYFYWTHRLMHWRPLFKYVHLGHHKSLTPTPWAIYSFQPLEAVIQFGILAIPVLFIRSTR